MSADCQTCHGKFGFVVRANRIASELTPAQRLMLRSTVQTNNPYCHISRRSAHGGAVGTLTKLMKLDLLDKDSNVTELGRAVFTVIDTKRTL